MSSDVAASLVSDLSLGYPTSESGFSPACSYPEYLFSTVSPKPNPVYEAVRNLLIRARLDEVRYDTADWNPLGVYIAPGSKVFVLCNFVYHRKPRESLADFSAKCIHGSVLRAVVDYALIAAGPTGCVNFGNAPLQACDWQRVLRETGAQQVLDFYQDEKMRVRAQDLRMLRAAHSGGGRVLSREVVSDEGLSATIDLGQTSLLAHLPNGPREPRFRVSDYDPQATESYHRSGAHRYVVNRAILEADVIISLSKMKTHNKVGITCGLKGFVGTVAQKDCLAHHRFGPPSIGGDEYSDSLRLLLPVSRFYDWVQRQEADRRGLGGLQVIDRSTKRFFRQVGADMAGSWHGNDTAWRMALDLARIVRFADATGHMQVTPQRRHVSFIDGIVAGEGEGPLAPISVPAGVLIFSDDVPIGDRIASRMMGFDPSLFPIVREAFSEALGLTSARSGAVVGREVDQVDVESVEAILARPFKLPRGWRDRHNGLRK